MVCDATNHGGNRRLFCACSTAQEGNTIMSFHVNAAAARITAIMMLQQARSWVVHHVTQK